MKKSPIKERILQYLDYQGISKYKFYQKTGLSKGTLDNTSGLTEDNLAKVIAFAPDVSLHWLINGEGSMFKGDISPMSMVREPKENYHVVGREVALAKQVTMGGVPLLDIEASAGDGSGQAQVMDTEDLAQYRIPDFGKMDFIVKLKGSSMYPKYSNGDKVACRYIKEPQFLQWGRPYVLHTADQGTICKRLFQSNNPDTLICRSDNKEYPDFEVPRADIHTYALVLGVIRVE